MSGTKKVKAFSEKYDRIAGARALLMIMKIFGIWKWNDKNDSSLVAKILQNLHRYVIHVPGSVIFCLLMWVDAFQASDLVQAGNVLYMSICLSVYNLKLLSVWILYSKNKQFINDLECNPVFELSTETEKAMWLSQQRTFYFVVAVFMCGSVLSGVAGFYGAIIAEDYQLGFDYYVPFEWRNPRYYWVAQAYDIMGICTCCFSNIAVDMLGCYQIFHIALLYKLLSLRFGELQTTRETEIMEKLLRCLQLQRNIRRLTKECEAIVSPYVVGQIIFSALIICFCGYRLQQMSILENLGQFFAMLQFMSVMILEVFLPCYFASKVTENSAVLIYDIYSLNWLDYSAPTRKFIILYMEFLKQPVRMKAGNYFEVGLPVFTKVMNNAYSFLALLMNVDN